MKKKWILTAVIGILVILAIIAGIFFFKKNEEETPEETDVTEPYEEIESIVKYDEDEDFYYIDGVDVYDAVNDLIYKLRHADTTFVDYLEKTDAVNAIEGMYADVDATTISMAMDNSKFSSDDMLIQLRLSSFIDENYKGTGVFETYIPMDYTIKDEKYSIDIRIFVNENNVYFNIDGLLETVFKDIIFDEEGNFLFEAPEETTYPENGYEEEIIEDSDEAAEQ